MLLMMSKDKDVRKAEMIKTLRITTIIVAVLAVGFIVSPAIFGARGDEEIRQFLNSPGAIEQFNKARDDKAKGSESQTSPLIKQAEAFALYLNPPAPPKKVSEGPHERGATIRPPVVSSKFNLIGTSYYALRPELSLALIDEPGKGYRWVRQFSEVGHLIIGQIKDGAVVVQDGQRTFELVAERPAKKSLLKGASFEPAGPELSLTSLDRPGPGITESNVPLVGVEEPAGGGPLPIDDERKEALENILGELKNRQRDAGGGDETLAQMINELDAMRVNTEEAEKLHHLGEELKEEANDVSADPNQAKYRKVDGPNRPLRSSKNSAEK